MHPFVEQNRVLPAHCEIKPPVPVPPNYQPVNSIPYQVKDGDDWGSVAHNIMDVKVLIAFNFKTTIPAEVNWYLHNYVGCTRVSTDKCNFGAD